MSIVNIIKFSTSRMNIVTKLPSLIVSFTLCSPNNQNIIAMKRKLNLQ